MTARLKMYKGQWQCSDEQGPKPAPIGFGHNPEEAYSWWLTMCSLWGAGNDSYWKVRSKLCST